MSLYRREGFSNAGTIHEGERIPVTGDNNSVVILDDQAESVYNERKGVLIQNRDADNYVRIRVQARGATKEAATAFTDNTGLNTILLRKDSDMALSIGEELQVQAWNSSSSQLNISIISFV